MVFIAMLLICEVGALFLRDIFIQLHEEEIRDKLPKLGIVLTNRFYQYYSIIHEFDEQLLYDPANEIVSQTLAGIWNNNTDAVPEIQSVFYAENGKIENVYPASFEGELAGRVVAGRNLPGQPNDPESVSISLPIEVYSIAVEGREKPSLLIIRRMIGNQDDITSSIGMIIDLNLLLTTKELGWTNQEILLAIVDDQGNYLFGDAGKMPVQVVNYSLYFPGSVWKINAAPAGGWDQQISGEMNAYWAAGLAISLVSSLLIYSYIRRRVRFQDLVRRHTRELEDEIWQRKRAEQMLISNEARFRLIYENLPIGYYSLNIRGELIDVNRAWLDMLGYSRMDVIGSPFEDYLAPESKEYFKKTFAQYKETGIASNLSLCMLRKDGQALECIMDGRIGYDEEGDFRQTHCILRDVTESKKAEQALRESEERYSSLFHDNHSVMLLTDPHSGEIVDANPAACAFYGYSLDEIQRKNIAEIQLSTPVAMRKRKGEPNTQKEHHYEDCHRLKNGEIRDIEVYSGHITLKGRRLLYSIIHDISLRKRTEEALIASREEYKREHDLISRIMETSPVSIFMVNPDGKVTFANALANRIFQLGKLTPEDPIYSLPDFWISEIGDAKGISNSLPFYESIITKGPFKNRLYTLEWLIGGRVILSVSGTPSFGEEGDIEAVIIIAEDVTEDVIAERALRESEERFRFAFEYATIGMALTGTDRRFMMVNRSLCEMLGYDEDEIIGIPYTALTYTDDLDHNDELFDRTLSGEQRSFALEKRYVHKDGGIVWVSLDSFLLRDPDGAPLYFITHMQDITRRKEVEEELIDSEQRYRELFECNPQAMWVHDVETLRFLAVNDAMVQQYGYTPTELLGMTIRDIRPADEIPHLLEVIKNSTDGYDHGGIWIHQRKDGTLLDVETSSHTINFGGKAGRLVLAVDVTERLQGERVAQQHTRELEMLSEVSSVLRKAVNREEMIEIVMDKAIEVVDADVGAMFIFEKDGVKLVAELGFSPPLNLTGYIRGDRLFRVSSEQNVVFIPDLVKSQEFKKSNIFQLLTQGLVECIVIPLKTAEAVIGLIYLGWRSAHDYTSDEQSLVTAIAETAGNALHRSGMMQMLEQRVSDRTRELSALYGLSAIASETLGLDEALNQSLKRLLHAMPNKMGTIHLWNEGDQELTLAAQLGLPESMVEALRCVPVGEGLIGQAMKNGEPILLSDLDEKDDLLIWNGPNRPTSYLGVIMRSHGKNSGVLSVFGEDQHPFNLEDIALLASGADQIGITVENLRLRQQAEQVAVSRERERLARELHDSVTQSLYSLTLFSDVGRRMLKASDTGQLDYVLSRLTETALQALKEMRLLVYELRPSALEKDGLIGAIQKRLEAVEKRAGVEARLIAEDTLVFPFPVEEALYGITLEALNNSLKHARANRVEVQIESQGDLVILDVSDDGKGFDPETATNRGGLGLISLRERTERLGGELKIETLPGKGTHIQVAINYQEVGG